MIGNFLKGAADHFSLAFFHCSLSFSASYHHHHENAGIAVVHGHEYPKHQTNKDKPWEKILCLAAICAASWFTCMVVPEPIV